MNEKGTISALRKGDEPFFWQQNWQQRQRLTAINHGPKRTKQSLFEHNMNACEHQRTGRTNSVPWHQWGNIQSFKLDEKRPEAFRIDRIFLVESKTASNSRLYPTYSLYSCPGRPPYHLASCHSAIFHMSLARLRMPHKRVEVSNKWDIDLWDEFIRHLHITCWVGVGC